MNAPVRNPNSDIGAPVSLNSSAFYLPEPENSAGRTNPGPTSPKTGDASNSKLGSGILFAQSAAGDSGVSTGNAVLDWFLSNPLIAIPVVVGGAVIEGTVWTAQQATNLINEKGPEILKALQELGVPEADLKKATPRQIKQALDTINSKRNSLKTASPAQKKKLVQDAFNAAKSAPVSRTETAQKPSAPPFKPKVMQTTIAPQGKQSTTQTLRPTQLQGTAASQVGKNAQSAPISQNPSATAITKEDALASITSQLDQSGVPKILQKEMARRYYSMAVKQGVDSLEDLRSFQFALGNSPVTNMATLKDATEWIAVNALVKMGSLKSANAPKFLQQLDGYIKSELAKLATSNPENFFRSSAALLSALASDPKKTQAQVSAFVSRTTQDDHPGPFTTPLYDPLRKELDRPPGAKTTVEEGKHVPLPFPGGDPGEPRVPPNTGNQGKPNLEQPFMRIQTEPTGSGSVAGNGPINAGAGAGAVEPQGTISQSQNVITVPSQSNLEITSRQPRPISTLSDGQGHVLDLSTVDPMVMAKAIKTQVKTEKQLNTLEALMKDGNSTLYENPMVQEAIRSARQRVQLKNEPVAHTPITVRNGVNLSDLGEFQPKPIKEIAKENGVPESDVIVLALVRHGESEANKGKTTAGNEIGLRTDRGFESPHPQQFTSLPSGEVLRPGGQVRLSELGAQQALDAGPTITKLQEMYGFNTAFVSPVLRAQETFNLATDSGSGFETVITVPGLSERGQGGKIGLSKVGPLPGDEVHSDPSRPITDRTGPESIPVFNERIELTFEKTLAYLRANGNGNGLFVSHQFTMAAVLHAADPSIDVDKMGHDIPNGTPLVMILHKKQLNDGTLTYEVLDAGYVRK